MITLQNGLELSADSYQESGISKGISRGVCFSYRGKNITGEGLGIGVPVIKQGGFTYFSSCSYTVDRQGNRLMKKFLIDSMQVWYFLGMRSLFFTRLFEKASNLYMKNGILQKIFMRPGIFDFLLRITGFKTVFEPAGILATAYVTYFFSGQTIQIKGRIEKEKGFLCWIYILNELSAEFLNGVAETGIEKSLPSGWEKFNGRAYFYNLETGITFLVENFKSLQYADVCTYWGRERSENLNWAGFEFEADCNDLENVFDFSYEIESGKRQSKYE